MYDASNLNQDDLDKLNQEWKQQVEMKLRKEDSANNSKRDLHTNQPQN